MSKSEIQFKVGEKVLETSGYTYDRTMTLRIGTIKTVGKVRMKVQFIRKNDEPRIEEFVIATGERVGGQSFYHHKVEPLTTEAHERFNVWKTRVLAEKGIREAGEKFDKAYRDNIRDDRTNSLVPTKNLQEAAELIEKALTLLKFTPEEN